MLQINPKMSVEIQVAYSCKQCKNQVTIMANEPIPPVTCCNCMSSDFQTLWKQKITTMTKVEPVP